MFKCDRKNISSIPVVNTVESLDHGQSRAHENNASVKEKNFSYSFRPIYYVSRVFGLIPFSLIHDSNGELLMPKVRFLDGFWSIILLCTYILNIISCFHHVNFEKFVFVLRLGNYLLLIACFVFQILVMGTNMCNRFRFVEILKGITIFDKKVSSCIIETSELNETISSKWLIYYNTCWKTFGWF